MPRRLPTNRPPTHPGEMLKEFLVELKLTQAQFAQAIGVSRVRLNELINGKRSLTSSTALRLERTLGKPAYWWLGLQQDYDLWQAMHGPEMKEIRALKQFVSAADLARIWSGR
jgi:addiction module HigA family antidote